MKKRIIQGDFTRQETRENTLDTVRTLTHPFRRSVLWSPFKSVLIRLLNKKWYKVEIFSVTETGVRNTSESN